MEMPSNTPIVLLQEESGSRFVPIWVGAVEATAIAYAQQGVMPPRPLTHDLFIEMVLGLEAKIESVRITDLTDGVFFAVIDVSRSDGSTVQISARPSDAIAIALRADAPISASEEVVEQAGVEIPMDSDSDSEGTSTGVPEDQVEKFREFLEGISPEDFDAPNS